MLNNLGSPGFLILLLLCISIPCKCIAFKKMGRNGWASLLLLIPVVNVFIISEVAEGHWKNADEEGNLKRKPDEI